MNIVEIYKERSRYGKPPSLMAFSTTAPTNPVEGQIWIDTSLNQLMAFANKRWCPVAATDEYGKIRM